MADGYVLLTEYDWMSILPVLMQANAQYRCNPADMPLEIEELAEVTGRG